MRNRKSSSKSTLEVNAKVINKYLTALKHLSSAATDIHILTPEESHQLKYMRKVFHSILEEKGYKFKKSPVKEYVLYHNSELFGELLDRLNKEYEGEFKVIKKNKLFSEDKVKRCVMLSEAGNNYVKKNIHKFTLGKNKVTVNTEVLENIIKYKVLIETV